MLLDFGSFLLKIFLSFVFVNLNNSVYNDPGIFFCDKNIQNINDYYCSRSIRNSYGGLSNDLIWSFYVGYNGWCCGQVNYQISVNDASFHLIDAIVADKEVNSDGLDSCFRNYLKNHNRINVVFCQPGDDFKKVLEKEVVIVDPKDIDEVIKNCEVCKPSRKCDKLLKFSVNSDEIPFGADYDVQFFGEDGVLLGYYKLHISSGKE